MSGLKDNTGWPLEEAVYVAIHMARERGDDTCDKLTAAVMALFPITTLRADDRLASIEQRLQEFTPEYVEGQRLFLADLVDKYLEYDGRKMSKHWLAAFGCERIELLDAALRALNDNRFLLDELQRLRAESK